MGKKKTGERKAPPAPPATEPKPEEEPKAEEKPKKATGLSGIAAQLDGYIRAFAPELLGDNPTEADVLRVSRKLIGFALDNEGAKAPEKGQTITAPDKPSKARTLDEAEDIAVREFHIDRKSIVAKREHATYFKIVYDGSPGWVHIQKA